MANNGLDSSTMSDETFVPSEAFSDAASFATTSQELKNVSNDVKLEVNIQSSMHRLRSNNTSRLADSA